MYISNFIMVMMEALGFGLVAGILLFEIANFWFKQSEFKNEQKRKYRLLQIICIVITPSSFCYHSYFHGSSSQYWAELFFIAVLIIIFIIDLGLLVIPNRILAGASAVTVVFNIIGGTPTLYHSMLGAAAGFLIMLLLFVISRGAMGAGDVKLMAYIGLVLGWQQVILVIVLTALIGAFLAAMLLILRVVDKKTPIPYAPAIVTAAWITLYFGDRITGM